MNDDQPESATFPSTVISSATYSARDRWLSVTFTSGNNKTYVGVEPSVWADMQRAPSVGAFFNSVLRGRYAS